MVLLFVSSAIIQFNALLYCSNMMCHNNNSAAEAEAAEAAIGNVLDDVGVDVMHGNNDEDTEMAQAAAYAAAAADGMAVVVDQAVSF